MTELPLWSVLLVKGGVEYRGVARAAVDRYALRTVRAALRGYDEQMMRLRHAETVELTNPPGLLDEATVLIRPGDQAPVAMRRVVTCCECEASDTMRVQLELADEDTGARRFLLSNFIITAGHYVDYDTPDGYVELDEYRFFRCDECGCSDEDFAIDYQLVPGADAERLWDAALGDNDAAAGLAAEFAEGDGSQAAPLVTAEADWQLAKVSLRVPNIDREDVEAAMYDDEYDDEDDDEDAVLGSPVDEIPRLAREMAELAAAVQALDRAGWELTWGEDPSLSATKYCPSVKAVLDEMLACGVTDELRYRRHARPGRPPC